jgi:hypothetical protein
VKSASRRSFHAFQNQIIVFMKERNPLAACLIFAGSLGALSGAEPLRYVKNAEGGRAEAVVAIDKVCAWPNLTLLPNGDLVVMIYNQPSHLLQPGDVECWGSEDSGVTWRKRGVPGPRETEVNARGNVAAGVAGNGDLVVLVSGWSGPFEGRNRGSVLPVWISRSSDGGRTWMIDRESFPKLPTGVDGVPYGDIVPGRDGALRAALYRGNGTFVFKSSDHGQTWTEPVLLDGGESMNETAIFHLGEGNWLAAARYEGLTLYSSADDGETWQKQGAVTGPQQHPGDLIRLRDGRLLLSNGNRAFGNVPQDRVKSDSRGIDVRFSDDEGRTWGNPYRVADFERDGGYPSSVQLADGRILTVYYARVVEGHDAYHMGVVIWDPEATEGQ